MRLAASRFASAISVRRDVEGPGPGVEEVEGVEVPEVTAGVPVGGRRLERMPVFVRLNSGLVVGALSLSPL